MAKTYSGDWRVDAHAINGMEGCHYDLANWVEGKGFEVEPDLDDNERSVIARPGTEDFGDRIIGEITGDAEAVVKIDLPEDEDEESPAGYTLLDYGCETVLEAEDLDAARAEDEELILGLILAALLCW